MQHVTAILARPKTLALAAALGLILTGLASAHPDGHPVPQPWYGGSVQSQPAPQMPGR
jgi:hypothetical protein